MNFKNKQSVEEILSTGLKLCNKCGNLKSINDFFSDKSKRDGLTTFCKDCKIISCNAWSSKNPDKIKIYKKKSNKTEKVKQCKRDYVENNKDKVKNIQKLYSASENAKAKQRKWILENRESVLNYKKKYNTENKEKLSEKRKIWRKKNKGLVNFWTNRRRERTRLHTPKWADQEKIKEFYKLCPDGYDVDHIIPLRGTTVSGLHVLENLQYLPRKENQQKSNKLIESYLDNETDISIITKEIINGTRKSTDTN